MSSIISAIVKSKAKFDLLQSANNPSVDNDYIIDSCIKQSKCKFSKVKKIEDNIFFICRHHGYKVADVDYVIKHNELCPDCHSGVLDIYDDLLLNYDIHMKEFIKNKYLAIIHRHYIHKGFESEVISLDTFIDLTFKECVYCGNEHGNTFGKKDNDPIFYNGIDRKDSNLGYTVGNSCSCCKVCNMMKREMSLAEFEGHIKQIYKRLNL